MSMQWWKAIGAGVAGAIAMSVWGGWFAPLIGLAPFDPPNVMAPKMANSILLGWITHLGIGALFAMIYSTFQKYLPGPSAVRGAIYSIVLWAGMLLIFSPTMGMGVFLNYSGMACFVAFFGHLAYGFTMGAIYDASYEKKAAPAKAKTKRKSSK